LAFRSFKRKTSSEEVVDPEIDDDSNLSMPSEERQCKFCEAVYSKSDQIRNHTLKHFESEITPLLPTAAKRPFKCPKCPEEYKEMTLLIRHYGFQHHCTEDDLNGKLYVAPVEEPVIKVDEKKDAEIARKLGKQEEEYRDIADAEDLLYSSDDDKNGDKSKAKEPKRKGRQADDEDTKMMKKFMTKEERQEQMKLEKAQRESKKAEEKKKKEDEKKKKEAEKKEEKKKKEAEKKAKLEEEKAKKEEERKASELKKKQLEEQNLKEKQERLLKEEEERLAREKEDQEQNQWASLPLEGDPSDDEEPIKVNIKKKVEEKDNDEFSGFGDLPLF